MPMFKNYYEVRNWLESFIPYTYSKNNLGIERIKHLLDLLGNPQKEFKSILVGGTSGKGSTAFYIAGLLEFAGPVTTFPPTSARSSQKSIGDGKYNVELRAVGNPSSRATRKFKVGLHLSPHLIDIRERLQINGELISPMRLIRLIGRIRPIVEKIQRTKPDLTPSYFEILVAASFLYFAKSKVDWAVVEVGLGGRLDATNVLEPKVSVITNIGLDHTDILGKTIEAIAYEKAGIIKGIGERVQGTEKDKTGVSVVTGATGKGLKVIKKVAKMKKARLITVSPQLKITGPKTDIKDYLIIYKDIERNTLHSFASQNFLLSLITVLALGFKPTKEAVWKVSRLGLEGRFELIDQNVILDGAHNTDKIKYLIKMVKSHTNYSNNQSGIVLVIGFKRGKSWKKMVDLLIKNLPIKKVIATKFNAVTDTGRFAAVDPKEIAAYVHRQGVSLTGVYSNSQEAVFKALNANLLGANQLILITGSLYLVGEVRMLWKLPFC